MTPTATDMETLPPSTGELLSLPEPRVILPGYPNVYQYGHRIVLDVLDGKVYVQEKVDGSQISFGLIIGGAVANLVDRLPDGLVTDYIAVGTFPVFNVPEYTRRNVS